MKTRTLAKILAEESAGANGAVDPGRVAAVCDYVEKNVPPLRKIPTLKAYMRILKPILKKEEALVEVSGEISEKAFDDIKKFVAEKTGRSDLRFKKIENAEILGGVRITCADTIWETSALSSLEDLLPGQNNKF